MVGNSWSIRAGKVITAARRPHLVLLDPTVPRKDGFAGLLEIRDVEAFEDPPILILGTSDSRGDIKRCYEMGANSFVTKPTGFSAPQEMFRSL
jgi:DNA-binding response OmpR family regulator